MWNAIVFIRGFLLRSERDNIASVRELRHPIRSHSGRFDKTRHYYPFWRQMTDSLPWSRLLKRPGRRDFLPAYTTSVWIIVLGSEGPTSRCRNSLAWNTSGRIPG
jgi:hypothetical protein